MATTYTKEQLDSVLSRVSAEVAKEVSGGEARGFQVADLRAQFADLVKGGDVAWTISYSTSSAAALGRLGEVAWTISYSTSSAVAIGKESTSR